ncbi:hypothetical protein ABIB57_003704 [Devosia sp. UYZn731]
MRVNVFISRSNGRAQNSFLAVPESQVVLPPKLRKHWQYFTTVDTADAMFRSVKVDEELSMKGSCVFTP